MTWMLVSIFAAPLAGVVLAVAWWLIRRHGVRSLGGTVGSFTLLAGVLVVSAELLLRFIWAGPLLQIHPPLGFVSWYYDHRYTIPLVIGVVGLVLLAFPIRSRQGAGVAELAPRGALRFTRPRWLIAPGALIAAILLISLLAGAASQPDPTTGRYDMYVVELSSESTMATAIYGWFYSIPALVAIAAMVAIAAVNLMLIARPPLSLNNDHDDDAEIRTLRSHNVIMVMTGALLLHLGLIMQSLAATASLAGSISSDVGRVTLSTPVAAMVPVFIGAAYAGATLGIAVWVTVALSAVGKRQPARVAVGS